MEYVFIILAVIRVMPKVVKVILSSLTFGSESVYPRRYFIALSFILVYTPKYLYVGTYKLTLGRYCSGGEL